MLGNESLPTTSETSADTAPVPEDRELVIDIRGLSKVYSLYPSARSQLMDILGFYRLVPWAKPSIGHHAALDGVDLQVRRGERIGIVGRNGAGKTTLLKHLTGAAAPSSGKLIVNGDIQALMQVGLGFHSEFTGRQNIKASLLYSGLTGEERIAAEEEIIAFCELGEYLDQPIKSYSRGMQSRLQFACATAIKPDILIVDEILGAGDAYFSAKSSMRMKKLTGSGCTLLLVSHSMAQILQFCDRVIWIDKGKIKRDGPARDIIGEYEVAMRTMSVEKLGSKNVKSIDNTEGLALRLRTETDDESVATQGTAQNSQADTSKDNDFNDAGELVSLADGQQVFRWPSEKGLKLSALGIFRKNEQVTTFELKQDIEFRLEVDIEVEDDYSCTYQITIFKIDGRRVTRIQSPVDQFHAQAGTKRQVVMALKPCQLCAGNYYVNLSILRDESNSGDAHSRRYDLVARFCDFEIYSILEYRSQPIFFHDADWQLGGRTPGELEP